MILSGKKIIEEVENKKIIIYPFNIDDINPNSYNYTLDDYIKVYEDDVLDAKKKYEDKTNKNTGRWNCVRTK